RPREVQFVRRAYDRAMPNYPEEIDRTVMLTALQGPQGLLHMLQTVHDLHINFCEGGSTWACSAVSLITSIFTGGIAAIGAVVCEAEQKIVRYSCRAFADIHLAFQDPVKIDSLGTYLSWYATSNFTNPICDTNMFDGNF